MIVLYIQEKKVQACYSFVNSHFVFMKDSSRKKLFLITTSLKRYCRKPSSIRDLMHTQGRPVVFLSVNIFSRSLDDNRVKQ